MEHFCVKFVQVNPSINYRSLNTHIYIYMYIYIYIYIYICLILTQLSICQPAGRPADGQHESRTKNIFFCKKNAVSHATFAGWPIKLAGLIIHV